MNNEGISLIDTKKGIPRLNFRFDKDYPEDFISIGSGKYIQKRTGDLNLIYLAHKFMHINDVLDEELFLKINNGNVLIIDDSFGSGVTMREASRAIKHLNPKRVDAFILLHDYAASARKSG